MKKGFIQIILLISHLFVCNGKSDGHLQPFGMHKLPNVRTAELQIVPQPRDFFKNYVKPRVPVIFRGAAKRSSATVRWSTDALKSNYGDLVVRLEARAESSSYTPATDVGYGRDTLRHFADNFKSMNAYVISQIPQPLEKDVFIPPCLRCGNFAKSIQEVHLFLVGKGGKTLLHRDPYSNIHCVFNGTKDWILVDDVHNDHIYQSESSEDEFGGYSEIDVDKVDLEKFPNIRKVNFSKITLNGGDCIFIPASYWHQVRVNGEYNTAVSIWFSRNFRHSVQDWSDCVEEDYDFTPMSDVDILWRFSGKNESLTQGHMDIFVMRSVLLSMADENDEISIKGFCNKLVAYDEDIQIQYVIEQIKNFFNITLDTVSGKTVRALSSGELKILLLIFDPSDVSNSLDYEYSVIEESDIRDFLETKMKDLRISKTQFIEDYTKQLGGSKVVADQIFASLDEDNNGYVTSTEVEKKFDIAVAKFRESTEHDPSTERLWLRHMRERNEL